MLKSWPRCKTCGNLIQVSTGRCVECDLPNLCFGCITAEYNKEDPQPHPGGTKRYMGCECWCHEAPEGIRSAADDPVSPEDLRAVRAAWSTASIPNRQKDSTDG